MVPVAAYEEPGTSLPRRVIRRLFSALVIIPLALLAAIIVAIWFTIGRSFPGASTTF